MLSHMNGSAFVLALCLVLGFSNGFRNSSLIVSTVVSTRALSPMLAFALCAVFEVIGALMFGTAIVSTIARDLFDPTLILSRNEFLCVLGCGVFAAILWGVLSWRKGIPISNSHALLAGLTGASWAAWGAQSLKKPVVGSIFLFLVFSPLIGFFLSWTATWMIRFLGEWMTLRVVPVTETSHVLLCFLLASADGSNNAQMILAVAVLAKGFIFTTESLNLPMSLRLAVAGFIAMGVLLGGRRILKKMGMSFYRIQVTEGLGALLTAATTIIGCNAHGFPVSTTQVITGSIVGAGVAKNPRAVKWFVAKEIVISWVLTIPVVMAVAATLCHIALKMGNWR